MKSDGLIDAIPPYQGVDVVLGGTLVQDLAAPVAGYVVTFPDRGLDAVMLTYAEATPEKLEELRALSKWPDEVFYRHAWLHSEQVVYGEIQKRIHWSPR